VGLWETSCVLFALTFVPQMSYLIWSLWTGRPLLIVDHEGVALGKNRLAWPEIKSIRISHLSPGGSVTIVCLSDPRRRSIGVQTTHVEYLDNFAYWLRAVHNQQHTTSSQRAARDGSALRRGKPRAYSEQAAGAGLRSGGSTWR
jgi:hypothetical protein